MPRLRILISGAGVGGIALAFWLSKLGHSVTIVERFQGLRVNGLQLDLRGHGITVMKRMGLDAAFRSVAAPEQGIQLVDSQNRRWAYFGANTSGQGSQSFTSEYEIMRADLCRIMHDAAKERVRYIFGASIESYDDKEAGAVEVRFTNGSVEEFDLLVGADGLRSRMRMMMFGAEAGFQPINDNIAYLRIPRPAEDGEDYMATAYLAPGGRFILTRRHNSHQLQVYLASKNLTQRLKSITRGDVEAEKEAFADEFRDAGWQAESLLDALLKSDDFYSDSQGIVKLDSWSSGRATLVGDAGYCSAANGLGTSCAIMGAYVLAGEIARHVGSADDDIKGANTREGIKIALDAYERKFRPYVNIIQKGLGEEGWFDNVQWKSWHLYIFYWVVWLASVVKLDRLLGRFMGDHTKEWDLPEYEELK